MAEIRLSFLRPKPTPTNTRSPTLLHTEKGKGFPCPRAAPDYPQATPRERRCGTPSPQDALGSTAKPPSEAEWFCPLQNTSSAPTANRAARTPSSHGCSAAGARGASYKIQTRSTKRMSPRRKRETQDRISHGSQSGQLQPAQKGRKHPCFSLAPTAPGRQTSSPADSGTRAPSASSASKLRRSPRQRASEDSPHPAGCPPSGTSHQQEDGKMLWPRQSNPGLPPRPVPHSNSRGQLPPRQTPAIPPSPCSRQFCISQPATGSHIPQAPQAVSKKHIEVSGEEARS